MGFINTIWLKLAGALAAIGAVLAVLGMAKRAGRKEVQAEQLEIQFEKVENANKVEAAVRKLGDGTAASELRSKWSRD
jgi:hypothetical protein